MILTADLHCRSTIPRARKDDFMAAQTSKLKAILELAQASPPLIVAGDLLHAPKSEPWLEQYLIGLFKEFGVEIICTLGQHDLPDHSLDQVKNGSVAVLEAAGVIRILTKERGPCHISGWALWGCAWGESPLDKSTIRNHDLDHEHGNLLIWHHMVSQDPLWPNQELVQPGSLLRQYPWFDLIVTGDNHGTIISRTDGGGIGRGPERLLVNPGSMMRQTAAQIDHRPCVFRYEDGQLEQIFLPVEPDALDLTRLEQEKERDSRIEAFVERLGGDHEISLSFQKNLEQHLEANQIRDSVKKLIWGCVK